MATISNTPRPGYVWDSTDNVWYPIGVGAHTHTANAVGAIANTLTTTTGDIIYASAANTPARLGIGTTGQVLKVNSGATAPEWGSAVAAAQSFVLLSTTTLSTLGAATATISSLSGYNQLLVYIYGLSTTNANPAYTFRFNGDSTSKYMSNGVRSQGTAIYGGVQWYQNLNSETALNTVTGSGTAAAAVAIQMVIQGANGTGVKTIQYTSQDSDGAAFIAQGQGIYTGTSVVSSLSLISSSGNFDAGTMYIYGAA